MSRQNLTYSSKVIRLSLEDERDIHHKRYEEARDQWIQTRFSGDLNRLASCIENLNFADMRILKRDEETREKCLLYKLPVEFYENDQKHTK